MNGHDAAQGPGAPKQDPVWRFFVGCAVVVAVLGGIFVLGALIVGWRLARDPAPGRPVEAFLVGDESRYWRIALEPGDAGLEAFLVRLDAINETTRRDALRGTVFDLIPLPSRKTRLDDLAPFALEVSITASDDASGMPRPTGWAARGTFSKGVLRMRAALKVMGFIAGRRAAQSARQDVDGIAVTEIRDRDSGFAVAAVGNRVLLAGDAARLRTVLQGSRSPEPPAFPELSALHEKIRLEGEDAWAFYSTRRPGGWPDPPAQGAALASFDLNANDELAFRVIVQPSGVLEGGSGFSGSPADCLRVVSRFLPWIPESAITIDGAGASANGSGVSEFSGRITGLSTRLAEALTAVSEAARQRMPSASPIPPFPLPPGDPRNGNPGESTHEGTPTRER